MREDRPFLVWSGRIEQEDFPQKKKALRGTLGNSPAAAGPVSSPHAGLWGILSPNPKHWEGQYTKH